MSSEEKSKELIEKFKKYAKFIPYNKDGELVLFNVEEELNNAKKCSIICVEEIIDVIEGYSLDPEIYAGTNPTDYWQQVLIHLNQSL